MGNLTSIRSKAGSSRGKSNPAQSNAIQDSKSSHSHLDCKVSSSQVSWGHRDLKCTAPVIQEETVQEYSNNWIISLAEGGGDVCIDESTSFAVAGSSLKVG